LAGGLWAALDADLAPGARFVLDAIGFDKRVTGSRLVITGEGRLDSQSLTGKLVSEIAARTRARGVPTCAIVGSLDLDRERVRAMGLRTVHEASTLREIEAAGRLVGDTVASSAQPHASFG
jgi:glycerate kinase